ncbi:mettl24 [Symbiodinium sp. CCMP2592]|nr:mettl24 [Symbiodinium sp. CCMP2592]
MEHLAEWDALSTVSFQHWRSVTFWAPNSRWNQAWPSSQRPSCRWETAAREWCRLWRAWRWKQTRLHLLGHHDVAEELELLGASVQKQTWLPESSDLHGHDLVHQEAFFMSGTSNWADWRHSMALYAASKTMVLLAPNVVAAGPMMAHRKWRQQTLHAGPYIEALGGNGMLCIQSWQDWDTGRPMAQSSKPVMAVVEEELSDSDEDYGPGPATIFTSVQPEEYWSVAGEAWASSHMAHLRQAGLVSVVEQDVPLLLVKSALKGLGACIDLGEMEVPGEHDEDPGYAGEEVVMCPLRFTRRSGNRPEELPLQLLEIRDSTFESLECLVEGLPSLKPEKQREINRHDKRKMQGLMELARVLTDELGFLKSYIDPAVFLLRNEQGILCGLVHVDDLVVCHDGSEFAQQTVDKLAGWFPCGTWDRVSEKSSGVTYCGKEIKLRNIDSEDGVILSKDGFIDGRLEETEVSKDRRQAPELPATEEERENYRSIVGGLQWIATQSQSRPDLSFETNQLQKRVADLRVADLVRANKAVREAKKHRMEIVFRNLGKDAQLIIYSDAGLCSSVGVEVEEKQADDILQSSLDKRLVFSQKGAVVGVVKRGSTEVCSKPAHMNILHWRSSTNKRVIESSRSDGLGMGHFSQVLMSEFQTWF